MSAPLCTMNSLRIHTAGMNVKRADTRAITCRAPAGRPCARVGDVVHTYCLGEARRIQAGEPKSRRQALRLAGAVLVGSTISYPAVPPAKAIPLAPLGVYGQEHMEARTGGEKKLTLSVEQVKVRRL
eukprot:4081168-Pyramimonas_sp.AAC.1